MNTVNLVVGISGLAIGVVGFTFTIWQLFRTRKAAVAAKEASQKTQSSLQSNVMLVDISACIGMIEEIKTSIRNKQYNSALIRVTDLTSQLIQIRQLPDFSYRIGSKMQSIVSQLAILRNTLEEGASNPRQTLDSVKINRKLSEISDCLNDWIGIYKYTINKGD